MDIWIFSGGHGNALFVLACPKTNLSLICEFHSGSGHGFWPASKASPNSTPSNSSKFTFFSRHYTQYGL